MRSPNSVCRRARTHRTWFALAAVATLAAAACGEDSDSPEPEGTVDVTEAPAGGTAVATTFPAYGGY